jgi:hypothetical protein
MFFRQADDGVMIDIVNKAITYPDGGRTYTRPVFEAPRGRIRMAEFRVYVATLDMAPGGVRIRFYQVK